MMAALLMSRDHSFP